MLRGSDRISRSELLKQVGEQKQQLALYEKKLKGWTFLYENFSFKKKKYELLIIVKVKNPIKLCLLINKLGWDKEMDYYNG